MNDNTYKVKQHSSLCYSRIRRYAYKKYRKVDSPTYLLSDQRFHGGMNCFYERICDSNPTKKTPKIRATIPSTVIR